MGKDEHREREVQRIQNMMHRDALATFILCGGEMTDIPFVTKPHDMAAKLLERDIMHLTGGK